MRNLKGEAHLNLRALAGRRDGFTIVELLIVIAIIAILMGLLMPTIAAIRQRSKVAATRTLMEGLTTALNRYYVDFEEYPPSTLSLKGGAADPASLYTYLCGKDGRGIVSRGGASGKETRYDPYMTVPPELLRRQTDGTVVVMDSWGKDFVYYNCREYTLQQRELNKEYITCPETQNPNSFDIFSVGPDRLEDKHPELIDDIANWKYTKP